MARPRSDTAYHRGLRAEQAVCIVLQAEGWIVRARRLRTEAGEIDLVAERDGLLAFIEVKARPALASAALALGPRQRARLLAAAAVVAAAHPDWGLRGMRFDLMLVDASGAIRRIADAFRFEA